MINVPYTNKMLDVEFETFRNKLLPGQKEEWKIKIKGKKGEKVAAEMVAALYDASLDVFKKNSWGLDVLNYSRSSRNWQSNISFSTARSELMSENWNKYLRITKRKNYDKLNWFGYSYGRRDYGYLEGVYDSDEVVETFNEYGDVPKPAIKKYRKSNCK